MNDSVTLYFKQGSSDKMYTAAIVPAAGCVSSKDGQLYRVNFAFGRRGDTLKPGTKTQTPVPRAEAEKIYNKLVAEKKGKGYTEGEDGTPYVGGDEEARRTGVVCQLLVPIDEGELAVMLGDAEFGAQEKYDGKRMILHARGGKIEAINRSGLTCGFPEPVERTLRDYHSQYGEIMIDGEAIGDVFHAFDLLKFGNTQTAYSPYSDRHYTLRAFFALSRDNVANPDTIKVAPLAVGHVDKANLYTRLKAEHREGIVFKRLSAPYTGGKPASGGDQFKFKFVQTCTAEVITHKPNKRSVGVAVLQRSSISTDQDAKVGVGFCTIPVNKNIPPVGALVEIRYLHAFDGGSLYQPFYLGERDDLRHADYYDTLKFKPAFEDDDGSLGLED